MDGVARTLPFEVPDCLDIEFKEFFLSSYSHLKALPDLEKCPSL